MDKNVVRFGLIGIILLVIFAAAQLYPPTEKLKPGIDLAGGTSLIYDIDTTGLVGGETDNLATKLRPILLTRIDPGNIQNIVMRPQGDTRIEIQVPLASADTHRPTAVRARWLRGPRRVSSGVRRKTRARTRKNRKSTSLRKRFDWRMRDGSRAKASAMKMAARWPTESRTAR